MVLQGVHCGLAWFCSQWRATAGSGKASWGSLRRVNVRYAEVSPVEASLRDRFSLLISYFFMKGLVIVMTNLSERQISNDAKIQIAKEAPFCANVRLQGTQDILFHRWDNEDVSQKQQSKKGSSERLQDNLEAYVYRNNEGQICIPGRYIVRAVVEAARSFQDPRSKKKAAKDLVQAAVMCDELLSPILINGEPAVNWEYEDRQRVCIMRSAITRTRPAFKKGWEVEFLLVSLVPDLVTPDFLRKLVDNAGLLIGLGDFRPTYGRFRVTHWDLAPYVNAEVI